MEHRRSGTPPGLVWRTEFRLRGAIRADGQNAQPGAPAQRALSRSGGQNHRAPPRRYAGHQRHAEDHRHPAALPRVPVLSDDVSARVSERRCLLSLRAAAQDRGKLTARWIAAKDFCARQSALRRHSSMPGYLLFVWERAIALLRERLLGPRGRLHSLTKKANAQAGAQRPQSNLRQSGDFFVKMRQGRFQRLAMIRIGGRRQIVDNPRPRELQVFDAQVAHLLLWRFRAVPGLRFCAVLGFDLCFDVLTFPSSSHASILTQTERDVHVCDGRLRIEHNTRQAPEAWRMSAGHTDLSY